MDNHETTALVWEALITASQPCTVHDLVVRTGEDATQVRRVLACLRRPDLVRVCAPAPTPSYEPVRVLDALQWAQAVDAGIPLSCLEQHITLRGTRREAARIASEGTVEALRQQERDQLASTRTKQLRGRAASKAAASDVGCLLKDLEEALVLLDKTSSSPDLRAVRCVLEQAHAQTKQAVEALAQRLEARPHTC